MGCSCKIPVEKYPETADWGPLFWKLLHGLAELAGTHKDSILQGDEIRTWIQILTTMKSTIPCDICRDHYARWLAEHPPSVLLTMPYKETGNWIRLYIFNLHNEINEGNEKPLFSFDDLSSMYKGVNTTLCWKQLEPVMKLAITLNGVTLLSWKKWLAFVRTLQAVYGVV
jgi:hypothetical protein